MCLCAGSATTTLLITDKLAVPTANNGEPPHELAGEEILDKPVIHRLRAQSAKTLRSVSSEGSANTHKSRPKTAASSEKGKTAARPITLSNVERWLSSSYQRL